MRSCTIERADDDSFIIHLRQDGRDRNILIESDWAQMLGFVASWMGVPVRAERDTLSCTFTVIGKEESPHEDLLDPGYLPPAGESSGGE